MKRQLTTVSEWMAHGNIMEYIRKNRVNRLDLVRDFTFPTLSLIKMQRIVARGSSGPEALP